MNAPTRNRLIQIHHPVVEQMVTTLRDQNTPSPIFRELVASIGSLLAYEATRDLATESRRVTTPLQQTDGVKLTAPITVVPILRAGLGLATGVLQFLPSAQVGHLGMKRNEETLEPESYYENLPESSAESDVLVVDPMLATGGSAIAAVNYLRERGCQRIKMLCLIAAPEGVAAFHAQQPDVPIYTAALDERLNANGFIVPGLGDAGDRLFGTG